jgi:hypothetical protein
VVGAVQAVLTDPNDPNIAYIGTVNGGIWKTTDATDANPDWQPLTDKYASVAIDSLARSPLDPTRGGNPDDDTIFAGTGRVSSLRRGFGIGVFKSTDGGATWQLLAQDTFAGLSVNGIVPTSIIVPDGGQVVLAATLNGTFDGTGPHAGGLYRSEDGGLSWSRISGTFGLPDDGVSEVVGDPGDPHRFYAAVPGVGIFRSTTDGISWRSVTGNIPASLITTSSRIRLAVSAALVNPIVAGSTPVFAAIVDESFDPTDTKKQHPKDDLKAVFRSTTGTDGIDQNGDGVVDDPAEVTWVQIGTAPAVSPGHQGDLHLSFLADNSNPDLIYLGGDRQANEPFVGNLFVGDAGAPVGTNPWTAIVESGANGTAPHADSRNMAFDSNGDILEVDDGGVSRLRNVKDPAARLVVAGRRPRQHRVPVGRLRPAQRRHLRGQPGYRRVRAEQPARRHRLDADVPRLPQPARPARQRAAGLPPGRRRIAGRGRHQHRGRDHPLLDGEQLRPVLPHRLRRQRQPDRHRQHQGRHRRQPALRAQELRRRDRHACQPRQPERLAERPQRGRPQGHGPRP